VKPSTSRKTFAEKFSIAAWLADTFVTSRLTSAFMLTCALIGGWALLETPRQDNPRIVVPAASVRVEMPGATPAELESLVIRPLEGEIARLPAVDDLDSVAEDSVAQIYVTFKTTERQEDVLTRLYDRIGARSDLLPPEAGPVLIRGVSVDDVPIVTLTLASSRYDDYALKRVADRVAEGLRTVPGASGVEVQGGADRELRIELDPDRMQAFGVTLDQLRAMLAAGNVAAPVGAVVRDGAQHALFVDGFIRSADDVRRTVVGQYRGKPIALQDVAQVIDGPAEERTRLSRLAFGLADPRFGATPDAEHPAVTIAVAKTAQANAVFVAKDILARVERMKQGLIPQGIDVVVTRNDGAFANDTVNGLIEHLMVAIGAVFLVVTIFLGLRQALIVGLGIPMVVALTLGMVYVAGYSINRVTLFGLILSLGLLVDDAIVVIENVHRHYNMPGVRDRRAATVLATREIGNPTNLATLAVMVVFLSLMTVGDMPGQFFFPIAYTVPVAMASSLIVAYTVVPWAALRWLPHDEEHASEGHGGEQGLYGWLSARYRRYVAPLIDNQSQRRRLALVVMVLVLIALLQPAWQFVRPAGVNSPMAWFGLEMGMMPGDNKNTFNIVLTLPETAPIEETDRVGRNIGAALRAVPEIRDYQMWMGRSGIIDFNGMLRGTGNKTGDNYAEIRVNLVDKHERAIKSHEVVRSLRPILQAIVARTPGATVQLVEDPPGPPVRANIQAEIYGHDPVQMRMASKAVREVFTGTRNIAEVVDTEPADVERFHFVVDREKAALSGVTAADVTTALRRLVAGEPLGRARIDDELNPVPIRLVIPRRYQIDPSLLSRAWVSNAQGVRVPLSAVVRTQRDVIERPIQRRNGERVTYVSAEPGESPPIYAVLDINRRLQGMALPDGTNLTTGNLGLTRDVPDTTQGIQVFWGGQQRQMLDTYRDMFRALGIAIALLYLILVAYYHSFSLPLVALAAIPLGLIGVFPGHWILGQQFTAPSIVGVIALAGVVVRNGLLIIDFVLEYRLQGKGLREAVIEAGAIRLRPIMLTALAVVLGSAIMLADPIFIGLAISLIFGTLASTVLSLLFLPVLLYFVMEWRERRDG
jgi:multidrug efflux pump subunit AcrB